MERRICLAVTGVLWLVCGIVIGLSPALDVDGFTPIFGWLTAVVGVVLLVLSARPSSGNPPRHSNGREASGRDRRRLVAATVVFPILGALSIYAGITSDEVVLTCFGVLFLSIPLFSLPSVLEMAGHR